MNQLPTSSVELAPEAFGKLMGEVDAAIKAGDDARVAQLISENQVNGVEESIFYPYLTFSIMSLEEAASRQVRTDDQRKAMMVNTTEVVQPVKRLTRVEIEKLPEFETAFKSENQALLVVLAKAKAEKATGTIKIIAAELDKAKADLLNRLDKANEVASSKKAEVKTTFVQMATFRFREFMTNHCLGMIAITTGTVKKAYQRLLNSELVLWPKNSSPAYIKRTGYKKP